MARCGGVARASAATRKFVLIGGADERREKRMRFQRRGLELRMELAAQEPRVVGDFHDFHVDAIRRAAGDGRPPAAQAQAAELLPRLIHRKAPLNACLFRFDYVSQIDIHRNNSYTI